ncbi:HAE1 family hydrophobic/amphiphilic exporter-1 [Bacillus oleivorans]|uniref:HAE1 family hydrophobic/amphiphilic exporter-1 n=1 Tax=Bacillus oleivorans TaxID=1448271 RepID=A0A285CGZ3_9BACI|nr:efflux RND transporter permease subunit [Bacillus oleivorans]SNX66854.1 HAE1 family hydrophobic/amphiphilic exporter-1 [Bacillus oleivorans]
MRSIINFVLKNKFAVWLLTFIVVIAGLYSGMNMKLETIPNINTPFVTVTTIYPGASPEEVVENVTEPIEQRISSLSGVDYVTSSSLTNASSIQIMYNFDKEMDEAEDEIKEALSSLTFPEGVQEPSVSQLSFNAFPVLGLSVMNDDLELPELTNQVEESIVPALEGLEGVASVQVSGQQIEEVQLFFDQQKLAELGLDEETVRGIITGSDIRFPLGMFVLEGKEKSVVLDGDFTSVEELKTLEIPMIPSAQAVPQMGQPQSDRTEVNGTGNLQPTQLPTVQLGEIASIEVVGQAESISRTNGKEAIGINIVKAQDANTVNVVNAVKAEIEDLESELEGTEVVVTLDQGKPIEESVNTMLSKAIFGALFAVLVIFLFLKNIRTTLISVISIPLSLLIAILVLQQLDITLNMMTLGAMTVAIGRVVDDSIVVIENIFRRMASQNEKLKGKDLIREATKEMFMPIMSSTIVTIAVFLPLGLVQGMVGELFLPFALTIVSALLASLLVAITIVPMMAHSLFKKGVKIKESKAEKGPGKLAAAYKKGLQWSLNHKWITSGIAVLLLAGSIALIPFVGISFLPEQAEKMVIATFDPKPGQTIEEVEEIAATAEEYFLAKEDVDTVQFSLGGENPMNPAASNQALFFVLYDPDTENFSDESQKVIEDLHSMTDAGEWGSMDEMMGMSSNQIHVNVYGNSIDEIKPVIEQLYDEINKVDQLENVESSISETFEEYTLAVNQEKLSQYGLTTGQVGMVLNPMAERPVLTTIEMDGKELNVYLEVSQQDYENIDDMLDIPLQSPLGIPVTVRDVVEVREGETSNTITRMDGRDYAQVSANIATDNVAEVSAKVQTIIDDMELPSGIEISMGGVTEDITESFTQLGIAMLAAIAIVYLVLVITFGGGLAPFAILFSLPFAVIGGVIALLIAGETLSISAMIGALMLIGIVVTNAIVLIDRVIHKENEGLSTREALLEAGTTRLRPILMTALATIGALIPLAIGAEGSGLISKGLGVTVIGGLTSSTLLTLIIVPVVYEALSKLKRKKADLS